MSNYKDPYFAFVDLEKGFDRAPRKVLSWALRKVGVDEGLIRTIQTMYTNAKSSVRINGQFSSWFDVQVGVHKGSVLSPLLFIIVMEALSRHFRTGCLWQLLYADDLVIIAETLSELLEKFRVWKANLESKGLRVNVDKTKILVSAHNAPKPVDGSKFPCGVCNKGVGINSIKCLACGFWVHKRCSNIKGPLKPDTDFKCKKCRGEVSNASIPDIKPVLKVYLKIFVFAEILFMNLSEDKYCIGGSSPRHETKLQDIVINLSSYDGCKYIFHNFHYLT